MRRTDYPKAPMSDMRGRYLRRGGAVALRTLQELNRSFTDQKLKNNV